MCLTFAKSMNALVLCSSENVEVCHTQPEQRFLDSTSDFNCRAEPKDVRMCRDEAFFLIFLSPLTVKIYRTSPLQEILSLSDGLSSQILAPVSLSEDESAFLVRFKDEKRLGLYACLPPKSRTPPFHEEFKCKEAFQSLSGKFLLLFSTDKRL